MLNMNPENIITALDMGSTNLTGIVASVNDNGSIDIIGASKVSHRGLRSGVVINIEETVAAIGQVIEDLERQTNASIKSVYIGIKGSHIEGFNHQGAIGISRTDKEITADDVRRVMDSAQAVPLSPDREILHVIPQDFIVDGQRGVCDPVGMQGGHLGIEVHIITGTTTAVNNIVTCINRAGFKVEDVLLSLLACSSSLISHEDKELGCVLIDIGGQSVNLAIFIDGDIRWMKELPVGGEYITRDIAYGMRIPLLEAKRMKEQYGWAKADFVENDSELEIIGVNGRVQRRMTVKQLSEIIEPRTDEIFGFIKEEIVKSGQESLILAGGFLTGGSGLLKGIDLVAEDMLGFQIRKLQIKDAGGLTDIIYNPEYSTAVGIAKYAMREDSYMIRRRAKKKKISIVKKVKNWLEETF